MKLKMMIFFITAFFVCISLSVSVDGKRIKYHRALWEDLSLPFPVSTHDIEQHEESRLQQKRIQHGRQLKSELTPLYPGYGTHFSYIYVGTPPQRQSVIIDTGSRYTAFPCTGCSQCGKHTDNYWDLKNSSTAKVQQCNNQPCQISQSYSEGSMWKGFRVIDKIFVGGLTDAIVPKASAYALDFMFACQTTETGLFRTQLADGIMGMSIADDTLPSQLQKAGLTDTKIFSLCYRTGGGIMTLGGVDQRIHTITGGDSSGNSIINYAQMINQNGWYGVKLLSIGLEGRSNSASGNNNGGVTVISGVSDLVNKGKGCIVDSGTTDTYFPSSLLRQFSDVFLKVSGVAFNTNNVKITPELLAKMPNIVFTFQSATDNGTFTTTMTWSNYIDSVGDGKYAFRIYLTEPSGFILGANFMNGYNIIFDGDGKRVGFAKSNCKYSDYVSVPTTPVLLPPPVAVPAPTKNNGNNNNKTPTQPPNSSSSNNNNIGNADAWKSNKNSPCPILPVSSCSAFCEQVTPNTAVVKEGVQTWINSCSTSPIETRNTTGNGQKTCHVNCYGPKLARGINLKCPDKPWSECSKACVQSRSINNNNKMQSQFQPHNYQHYSLDSISTHSQDDNNNSNHHHYDHRNNHRRYLAAVADSNGCAYTTETRVCFTGACPVSDGDYLVFVDMKVRISPFEWSYVHKEAFYAAFANIFKVKEGSVDLLNDANAEYTNRVKLRFEMRLKAKSYTDIESFTLFAENIPNYVKTNAFITDLIDSLSETSENQDHLDYSRYGWLKPTDIDISNVIVLPKGSARDPVDAKGSSGVGSGGVGGSSGSANGSGISGTGVPTIDLVMFGIALGAVSILAIVLFFYFRLRQEHAALEKDKVMGGSLRRMWDKFTALQGSGGKNNSSGRVGGRGGGSNNQGYKELNMHEFSSALETGKLSADEDTQLDMDDDNANRG